MSRNSFSAVLEIDGADIEEMNRKLKRLGADFAPAALRNGFRTWTNLTKKQVAAIVPRGPSGATERVRGQERPNPHLKDHVVTKVKGFRQGQVIWAAVGIREKKGSYATPHWYARWVEFGHTLKVRATAEEELRAATRGAPKRERQYKVVGRVEGKHFLQRALQVTAPRLVPIMEEAIARQVLKYWGPSHG